MRPLHLLAAALVATNAAAQTIPKKQIAEDLRLDGANEDFPGVGTVVIGPQGQMVVVINDDQQLRFYDASGKKTATFGRKGSGPGEFQRMTRHGWIADTLWVYDVSLRRVTYISPAVALLRTETVGANLNQMTSGRGGTVAGAIGLFSPSAIAGGRYIGIAMVIGNRNTDGTVPSTQRVMSVGVRATRSGGSLTPAGDTTGVGDRVFLGDAPDASGTTVNYRPGNGSAYSQIIPFTFYPTTVYSQDGSRFANIWTDVGEKGGTYSIAMLSTKGDSIFKRSYSFTGTPIPSSVADSALNAIGVGSDGKPFFPPAVSAKLREGIAEKMPRVYPPVTSMIIGADGTSWISGRLTPQGRSVTAIDPRGNPLFTLDLPPKTRLVQANRTTLWTVQTDADDLPSVVRYRIR